MGTPDPLSSADRDQYASFFRHCPDNFQVCIEATPHYLQMADHAAPLIDQFLPGVKLIFILREPVERCFTVFRNLALLEPSVFGSLDFDTFVEYALSLALNQSRNSSALHRRCLGYVETGFYAQYIARYLSCFPKNRILVLFFDELKDNPRSLIKKVSVFLDIDENFYERFKFTVENKTRSYRYDGLHLAAHRLNMKLEPLFNKYPSIKGALRQVYWRFNATAEKTRIAAPTRQKLDNFYRPHNDRLNELLSTHYPETLTKMPAWLNQA